MNKRRKNIFKKLILVFLLGIILFFVNEIFIQDWREKNSKERVEKSIVVNYEKQVNDFHALGKYLEGLEINPLVEIEFSKQDQFVCTVGSKSADDSDNGGVFYFTSFDNTKGSDIEFELNKNGTARVIVSDTIFETTNWTWVFEGNKESEDFNKLISYIGITEDELNTLCLKIKKLNCEAIRVDFNNVAIRYDGHPWYQYEYLYTFENSIAPIGYKNLGLGIYSGLYDNGLLCADVIFKK